MALMPSLVSVSRIQAPEAAHDPARVERLALAIARAGGSVTPLVVRALDPIGLAFALVDGDLALAAARRARAIDPTCEKVLAFVLTDENEAGVVAQLAG